MTFTQDSKPTKIQIKGSIGGYVKVGSVLKGNPHKAQPNFLLEACWEEVLQPGGKKVEILGGADLFVRLEVVPDVRLPTRVEGTLGLYVKAGEQKAVYLVGREWNGGNVVTSPIFFTADDEA